MLEIRELSASIGDKLILRGIDLTVPDGEVHALMGPNGSGKSTLGYVLSGRDDYQVTGGSVTFNGVDLLDMQPEQRAAAGVFLAFQAPIELPGVNNANFLRTALNAIRRAHAEPELDAVQFLKMARAATKQLAMPDDMLKRNVNVGFSGGEKKRNEVLQMAILRPKLAILDETDSGLDIDALKIVADGVNALRGPGFSALVITHHQRLLDHLIPNRVHVLAHGRIVRSGGPDLAKELEKSGYAGLIAEAREHRRHRLPAALPGHARTPARRFCPARRRRRRLQGSRPARRNAGPPDRGLEVHQPAPGRRSRFSARHAKARVRNDPRRTAAAGRAAHRLRRWRTARDLSTAAGFARFAEEPDFGTLTWPDREPMVALNTMLATDGAALHVPAGFDAGIVQLVSIAGADGDFHPRHSIRLGKGAQLTLLEISAGQGAYLLNTVAEIHVAEGAHLTHIRLQDEAATAFHVSTTYADVATKGTYDSFTLNLGASLSRTEVHAQLSGPAPLPTSTPRKSWLHRSTATSPPWSATPRRDAPRARPSRTCSPAGPAAFSKARSRSPERRRRRMDIR